MIRREPCLSCPYRRDVSSGLWAPEEYEKLPPYDAETFAQPAEAFRCHATPEAICCGWAVVGGWDLLGLRLATARGDVDRAEQIPTPSTPLFTTHTEAALHGLADVEDPSLEAKVVMSRLIRKYPRIKLREH